MQLQGTLKDRDDWAVTVEGYEPDFDLTMGTASFEPRRMILGAVGALTVGVLAQKKPNLAAGLIATAVAGKLAMRYLLQEEYQGDYEL